MQRLPPWVWLVLAVVFGFTATFLALGWLKGQSQRRSSLKGKMVPVVVAARDIEAAASLSPEMVAVRLWPPESQPKGSFAKPEDIQGRVTVFPLSGGEPVLESRLVPPGAAPGLPALMGPEKRAMTVKVDEASGVAGFLTPNCRVDVLVTVSRGDFSKDPVSRIVLQDLRVLGTGQKIEQRPGEKPQVVPTVTLEVSPEEGERLALAAQEGHLALVLRGRKDQKLVETNGVSVTRLLGTDAAKSKPKVPSGVSSYRGVEVLRGLKKESRNF
jgi:pilus assembly protein CpaB